uniref:Uncharacterized protein n=1 Tax=Rousettus aegyptiacus TaxID=9407 RepID=A0A7J8E8R0_ROUAE|nr:hypothetical protein HJG63_008169 [Rousettus aegyptiacus]
MIHSTESDIYVYICVCVCVCVYIMCIYIICVCVCVCVCPPPKFPSIIKYLTLFTPIYLPNLPLVTTNPRSMSISLCFFVTFICCFQLCISHKSDIMWFSTFSVCHISLSMVISRPIHVVTNGSS